MKLLFNLDVIEGNPVKARPSEYLVSLPVDQQITAIREFLQWAENEARAEAEIGVATATEYLQKMEDGGVRIYTGSDRGKQDE